MTIHLHRVLPSESGIGFVFGVESGCNKYFLWASIYYVIYLWRLSIFLLVLWVVLVLDDWDDDFVLGIGDLHQLYLYVCCAFCAQI